MQKNFSYFCDIVLMCPPKSVLLYSEGKALGSQVMEGLEENNQIIPEAPENFLLKSEKLKFYHSENVISNFFCKLPSQRKKSFDSQISYLLYYASMSLIKVLVE